MQSKQIAIGLAGAGRQEDLFGRNFGRCSLGIVFDDSSTRNQQPSWIGFILQAFRPAQLSKNRGAIVLKSTRRRI